MDNETTPARFWYNQLRKDAPEIFLSFCLIFAVACCATICYKSISASGQGDYCTVNASEVKVVSGTTMAFALHVPWRVDRTIAERFATLDAAIAACESLGLKVC